MGYSKSMKLNILHQQQFMNRPIQLILDESLKLNTHEGKPMEKEENIVIYYLVEAVERDLYVILTILRNKLPRKQT